MKVSFEIGDLSFGSCIENLQENSQNLRSFGMNVLNEKDEMAIIPDFYRTVFVCFGYLLSLLLPKKPEESLMLYRKAMIAELLLTLADNKKVRPFAPKVFFPESFLKSKKKKLKKIFTSLEKSDSFYAVVTDLGNPDQALDLFKIAEELGEIDVDPKKVKIPSHIKKISSLLKNYVTDENYEDLSTAYWECNRYAMLPVFAKMKIVKKKLDDKQIIDEDGFDCLNKYLLYIHPFVQLQPQNEGMLMDVFMRPVVPFPEIQNRYDCLPEQLLSVPAYLLAREIEEKLPKPYYVRQCSAPSCQKEFVTGRKNAKVCQGSNSRKKNKCSLEWTRYSRWLKKTGKNPEKDYSKLHLQKQFLQHGT